MRTKRERQERLYEIFVAPETTCQEFATMDLLTATQHIHELREAEPDEIPMTDGAIARELLDFAELNCRWEESRVS